VQTRTLVLFADDQITIAYSEYHLQRGVFMLLIAKNVGMEISPGKCEI
jgi:vancomycin permeability regulator SanA